MFPLKEVLILLHLRIILYFLLYSIDYAKLSNSVSYLHMTKESTNYIVSYSTLSYRTHVTSKVTIFF